MGELEDAESGTGGTEPEVGGEDARSRRDALRDSGPASVTAIAEMDQAAGRWVCNCITCWTTCFTFGTPQRATFT
jgi:hypothetical protein